MFILFISGPSPVPSGRVPEAQPGELRPRSGITNNQQSMSTSNAAPASTPRLSPRKADFGDVVNRVAEEEMGVPYKTLVPPKLGPSGDQRTKTRGSPAGMIAPNSCLIWVCVLIFLVIDHASLTRIPTFGSVEACGFDSFT